MALAKDLSSLPSSSSGHGENPVKKPTLGPLLAQAWADRYVDTPEHPLDLPMSDASARVRFSWAGSCGRQIGYRLTGEPVTEDLTVADHWRFGLGHLVHDQLQAVLQAAFGSNAQVEVHTKLEGGMLAGHADVEIAEAGRVNDGVGWTKRTSVEIKTINGFGFKKAVGARGPAEGPRTSAKLQGALNAKASDADELVILYLALELLSPREAKNIGADEVGRFCAEWHYTRDEYMPWADAEHERLLNVIATVDAGGMPPAFIPFEMPEGAVVVDPIKGMWQVKDFDVVTDAGSTWQCNYCPFQSVCSSDMQSERKAA
jgi:hypothetical protein